MGEQGGDPSSMGVTTRPLLSLGEVLPDRYDSDRNTQMLENSLRDNMDGLAGNKNFK